MIKENNDKVENIINLDNNKINNDNQKDNKKRTNMNDIINNCKNNNNYTSTFKNYKANQMLFQNK